MQSSVDAAMMASTSCRSKAALKRATAASVLAVCSSTGVIMLTPCVRRVPAAWSVRPHQGWPPGSRRRRPRRGTGSRSGRQSAANLRDGLALVELAGPQILTDDVIGDLLDVPFRAGRWPVPLVRAHRIDNRAGACHRPHVELTHSR